MRFRVTVGIVAMVVINTMLFFGVSRAGSNQAKTSFKYIMLTILETGDSAIVFTHDGQGKEYGGVSQNSSVGSYERLKESIVMFIEKYTNKKYNNKSVSIVSVLDILGLDGWEVVSSRIENDKFIDGKSNKSTIYLLKKRY